MKKLFITGGNGNIGSAIKTKFQNMGYEVIAPTSQNLNLANLDEIKQYFEMNPKEYDVFIHCAGFNSPQEIEKISLEDIEKSAKINYVSFFEIVKQIVPSMKINRYGHILAISSLYGTITRRGRLAYTSSKHALNGMVQTMACEFGEYNILVNSLAPGFVDTQMTRKNNSVEQIKSMEIKIPLKRLAKPEEIANAAYFLCSKENSYISGQNVIVDGGFMAEGGQNNV